MKKYLLVVNLLLVSISIYSQSTYMMGYDQVVTSYPLNNGNATYDGGSISIFKSASQLPVLIKTDSVGIVHWAYSYDNFGVFDIAGNVIQTKDSGYAFVASAKTAQGTTNDIVLVKLTKSGMVSWAKVLADSSVNLREQTQPQLKELNNGGYLISAFYNEWTTTPSTQGAAGQEIYVYKTDNVGNVIWNKIYSLKGSGGEYKHYSSLNGLVETTDGSYVFCGNTGHDFSMSFYSLLFKLDVNGTLLWEKYYGWGASTNDNIALRTLIENNNGSISAIGWVSNPNQLNGQGVTIHDGILMTVDVSNGNLLNSKRYNYTTASDWLQLHSINQLANGELLMTGRSLLGQSANNSKAVLLKTTSTGNVISAMEYDLGAGDQSEGYFVSKTFKLLGRVGGSISLLQTDTSCNVLNSTCVNAMTINTPTVNIGSKTTTLEPVTFFSRAKGLTLTTSPFCMNAQFVCITSASSSFNSSCNNYDFCAQIGTGKMFLSGFDSIPGFSYEWTTYNTGILSLNSPVNNCQSVIGTLLAEGTDSIIVTVKNESGCVVYRKACFVSVKDFDAVITTSSVTCIGVNSGGASATVNSGVAPYAYSWSNGSTLDNVTGLITGSYSVLISDANGCTSTSTFDINAGEPVLADVVSITNVLCFGDATGSASISVSSGTPNYTYSWNNGQSTSNITGLDADSYFVTVKDANGCSITLTVNVTEANKLLINLISINDSCNKSVGAIISTVSGGGAPYQYNWNNGSSTNLISNLAAGNYTMTVIDDNGCVTTETITVAGTIAPIANAGMNSTIKHGESIQLSATGGGAYQWNPSIGLSNSTINNPFASPSITTTYTLIVTDVNGCTDSDVITVYVEYNCDGEIVYIPNSFSPNGDGNNDLLYVRSNCIKTFSFKIFNRWGEKVFETNDQTIGWDGTYKGKLLEPGVYAYFMEAVLNTSVDNLIQNKGDINLMR